MLAVVKVLGKQHLLSIRPFGNQWLVNKYGEDWWSDDDKLIVGSSYEESIAAAVRAVMKEE